MDLSRATRLVAGLLACVVTFASAGAASAAAQAKPMTVRAALDASALQPGKTARVAVVLDLKAGYHAQSHTPTQTEGGANFIPTVLKSVVATDGVTTGEPIYPAGVNEDLGPNGVLNVYSGQVVIILPLTVKADAKPGEAKVTGSVYAQICDDKMCLPPKSFPFELTTKIVAASVTTTPNEPTLFQAATTAPTAAPPPPPVAKAEAGETSLAAWFGWAFLVGIMFNVVPCVLPVLPLKAVGFYETAGHNRAVSVTYGLAFGLGVVAVFLAMGLLVVVFKAITWGQPFSNPWFTGTLVIVLLAMALNMFGLFTVSLPTKAYMFSPRHDTYFGNVLFGVLTAVLSTPCTFGLFGAVLGVALSAPPVAGLGLIVVVGVGMASPYVLLSALPEVARKFPRTGPWAELMKQFMGFLILAVAVFFAQGWIAAWVSPRYVYWVIFAVLAAGCLYLLVRAVQFGKTRLAPTMAGVITLSLMVPAYVVAQQFSIEPYHWQPYTPQLLAELRAKDKVILVDFTATWCVNCHTVEKTVLNAKPIQKLVSDREIQLVRADITDEDGPSFKFWKDDIKAVGVPLTLVYPPGGGEPIEVNGIYNQAELTAALDRAAGKAAN